jgi:hypothetical protein
MKVKIGNRIYNSNDEPIMIIFDIGEKGLVEDMRPQDMKFCAYPQGTDAKTIEHFMNGKLQEDWYKKMIDTTYDSYLEQIKDVLFMYGQKPDFTNHKEITVAIVNMMTSKLMDRHSKDLMNFLDRT